jgi:pseudouridine 5'-phosphatase
MRSGIAGVVFDLDGTLLDTEGLYTEAAKRVCERYGATYTLALKRRTMGGDTLDGARLVTRELGLPISPETYVEERERELIALLPTVAAMPGARALVEALAKADLRLAIATSGHRHITEQKLALHPFLSVISAVVCGDDTKLERPKPAPDIYLLAARAIDVSPSNCMAVEDSVHGVHAALAAGMYTVALVDPRWGFPASDFAGAHRIIGSLEELTLP